MLFFHRFNEISAGINSTVEYRLPVRRDSQVAVENVIARAKVRRGGGVSTRHKDERTAGSGDERPRDRLPRPPLSSGLLPISTICQTQEPLSPTSSTTHPDPAACPLVLCSLTSLRASLTSFLPSFLSLTWLLSFLSLSLVLSSLAPSSPNGRAASILTSALRIYFGPVP